MSLLPPQVRSIRAALANGDDYKTIARAHGVLPMHIANIHKRGWYAHIPDNPVYTPNPAARKMAIEAMLRALKRRGITHGAQYWAALADLRECEQELAAQIARAA